MKALAIVCLLAGTASAEYVDPYIAPSKVESTSLLGFGIGGGKLPGHDLDAFGLDVNIEHQLVGGWRLYGEYEYMFIGKREANMDNAMLADGSGHRIHLGLRHSIARTRVLAKSLRLFVDAELGCGLLVGSATEDTTTSTLLDAHAFVGVHAGYDLIRMRDDTRASPVWEPSLWFRVLGTARDQPIGWSVGVGMAWGG